jgi:hypothetical protein
MKKPNNFSQIVRERRNRRLLLKQRQDAKHRRYVRLHPHKPNPIKDLRRQLRLHRRSIAESLHRQFAYPPGETTVEVAGHFGMERAEDRQSFLDLAGKCIDFNTSKLTLDIRKATRIWPSAVTLLCSLKEWVEFGARSGICIHPTISSNDSESDQVTSYLNHCGLHDYVGRTQARVANHYKACEVVRIQRERDRSSVEPREKELLSLIRDYSLFDHDQLELFDSIVLTESFLNVLEHGIVNYDQGWFVIAQLHPTHGFISLCIADNGIGFRNTLMTGPQRYEIGSRKENVPLNDGEFLKMALTEVVSGAYNASTKEGVFVKKYAPGSRRGNGLKRIIKACQALSIQMCVLSHQGYAFYSPADGSLDCGSRPQRIFAGTMYTFIIPARQSDDRGCR